MSRVIPPYSYHPTSKKVSTSYCAGRDTRMRVRRLGEILLTKGDDNCLKLEAYASMKSKKPFQSRCRGRLPNGRRPTLHVCWDFGDESLKSRGSQDLAMLNAVNDIIGILKGLDPEGETIIMEVTRAGTDLDSRANSSRSTSYDITGNHNLSSSLEPEKTEFSAESNEKLFKAVPMDRAKQRESKTQRTVINTSRPNLKKRERSSSLSAGYGKEELPAAATDEISFNRSPRQSHANHRQEHSKKRTSRLSREPLREKPQMHSPRELRSRARKLRQKNILNVSSSDSYVEAETHSHEVHDQLGVRHGKRHRSEQGVSGSHVQPQSHHRVDVNVPAVEKAFKGPAWRSTNQRIRVKTLIDQYRYLHKLYQNQDMKRKGFGVRPDTRASNYMKTRGYTMHKGFSEIGTIPGVEIGDIFSFREELHLLGVHRAVQAGIDFISAIKSEYTDKDGKPLTVAVSVVSSGGYKDNGGANDGAYLVYSGSGGVNNLSRMCTPSNKRCQDQKLVRGNLSMKNSCDLQIPIRVICGFKPKGENGSRYGSRMYCYAGLYNVRNYYTDTGLAGAKVWKFTLVRQENQPRLPLQLITSKGDLLASSFYT